MGTAAGVHVRAESLVSLGMATGGAEWGENSMGLGAERACGAESSMGCGKGSPFGRVALWLCCGGAGKRSWQGCERGSEEGGRARAEVSLGLWAEWRGARS